VLFKTSLLEKGNLLSLNDTNSLDLLSPKPLAFFDAYVAQHLGLARQSKSLAWFVGRQAEPHPFNGVHGAHVARDPNRAGATSANTHAVQVARIVIVRANAMPDEYLAQLTSLSTINLMVIKNYNWHQKRI
jgi:hypothetical protein